MTEAPSSAKDDLQRLAASGALTSARSPVYLWMWRNYAGLAVKLDGARVHWPTFAASLADLGVVDGNGAAPKAETVRRTWWRVRKAKKATRERTMRTPAGDINRPLPVPVSLILTQPEQKQAIQPVSAPTADAPNDDLARIRAEMNRRSGR